MAFRSGDSIGVRGDVELIYDLVVSCCSFIFSNFYLNYNHNHILFLYLF